MSGISLCHHGQTPSRRALNQGRGKGRLGCSLASCLDTLGWDVTRGKTPRLMETILVQSILASSFSFRR